MTKSKTHTFGLLLALLAGPVYSTLGQAYQNFDKAVVDKASVELGCPKAKITIKELAVKEGTSQYQLLACGKKTFYDCKAGAGCKKVAPATATAVASQGPANAQEPAKPAEAKSSSSTSTAGNTSSSTSTFGTANSGDISALLGKPATDPHITAEIALGILSNRFGFVGGGYGIPIPLLINGSYQLTSAIDAGVYVTLYRRVYRYGGINSDYKWKLSSVGVGATGTYHIADLLKSEGTQLDPKLDLYGRAYLGLNFLRWRYTGPDAALVNTYVGSAYKNRTRLNLGLTVGARYALTSQLKAVAEIGYGPLSWLTIGIAVDL